jgi:hypothetical protein
MTGRSEGIWSVENRAEPSPFSRNRSVKVSPVEERLQRTNSFGDHSLKLKANARGLECLLQLRERIRIWYGELQLISRNRFL